MPLNLAHSVSPGSAFVHFPLRPRSRAVDFTQWTLALRNDIWPGAETEKIRLLPVLLESHDVVDFNYLIYIQPVVSAIISSSNATVSKGLAIHAQQHALRALKSLPPPLKN